jgi:predicted membrane-bound spermidine synthase
MAISEAEAVAEQEAPATLRAGAGTYAGLFLVTLATLMHETLLTRIFSVTMWYHFAFVAISVALFGMTVGALVVYLLPDRFTASKTNDRLILFSLLFGVSIVLSFLTQLSVPFVPKWSLAGVYSIGFLYLVISVPFVFSGVCVCLALTRFPQQISRLYAADLMGAAVGAIALVWLLNRVDAPSAVIVISVLPAIAAFCFAAAARRAALLRTSFALAVALLAFAMINASLFNHHKPLLRVTWVGGPTGVPFYETTVPDYEKWNVFSRIRIDKLTPNRFTMGWGLSPTFVDDPNVQQYNLAIDTGASTVLTHYSGQPQQINHLKYDVTNLAHWARSPANVLVMGVGGGRDLLSALAFDQRHVTGVEINGQILHAVDDVYGDFTGHLDRNPRITMVNDEARSYVTRSSQRYDIIQMSLTDTWAATSAGAFALSENSLYTTDAWKTFLDHLTPNGLLAVSRWYYVPQPIEAYRLVALAVQALRDRGVDDPRSHIYVAKAPNVMDVHVATLLVSPSPLSDADLATLDRVTSDLKFDRVLTPTYAIDDTFEGIVEAPDVRAFAATYPYDISPPSDDKPFFFQMIRPTDIFHGGLGHSKILTEPFLALVGLTVAVLVLAFLCIVLPLLLTAKRVRLGGMLPFLAFFAAIGLGFLFIEVSQMQRLTLFLGHPTYALSVVLFSLLLFSGIGSYATERIAKAGPSRVNLLPFLPLLVVLVAVGLATPVIADHVESATTPVRIFTAVALLAPMGLAMGMPFPVGMRVASALPDAPTPFFWGVNGAMSVCASVLAMSIAQTSGISMAFWVGCACYVVAALGLLVAVTRRQLWTT